MKNRYFLLFIVSFFPLLMWSQDRAYDSDALAEYYFGHLPSARAMAMGNADVSVGGAVGSIYSNPAAIGSLNGLHTEFSEATPLYLLSNHRFHYIGASYRVHPKLNVAATVRQSSTGETDFEILVENEYYPLIKPTDTDFALTLAATPIKNLHVGFGVHQLRRRDKTDLKGNVWNFDAGLLYGVDLPEKEAFTHKLQFGASLTNLNRGIMDFSIFGVSSFSTTPAILRTGASYLVDFQDCDWTVLSQVEYQDVINSEFTTAFRVGAEGGWKNLLFARLGAYTLSLDDAGLPEENRSRISDFTYGFGARIPFHDLSKGKIPFDMNADLTVLEMKGYGLSTRRLDNFSNFAFRMTWYLEE